MKKNNKIIIAICIIIIILIIALIIISQISKNQKQKEEIENIVNSYTSPEQFKTIEEVATYLECDFIKQEVSKSENYSFDVYIKIKYLPYTNNQSNEAFYNRLISYTAKVLNYNNFRIIDKTNDIWIEVICNNETKKIKNKMINGENNYFAKHDSYIEISKIQETKETEFDIQSDILKKIISNNWQILDKNIGTQESIFNLYDIYFDEGIEVKKINNKIFNIVFTKKYKENIVNDIKTTLTKQEIINILGEPTFEKNDYDFIGYKGKDLYLFFNSKNEISVYKVENEEKDFSEFIDEYIEDRDSEKLIKKIKEKYQDFDIYQNTINGKILQYTLDGISLNFEKNRNIEIYNNYIGKIYGDKTIKNLENITLPDNIIIKNENLVVNTEFKRIQNVESLKYQAIQEDTNNNSKNFYLIKTSVSDGIFKIQFLSKDDSCANSELKENVDTYLWITDNVLAYSIKNNGIYLYNAQLRKYKSLITGKDEFNLIEYKDGTLRYDDKSININ